MANEKMNDLLLPDVEDVGAEYSAEMIEAMRAEIADLEEKENSLNEKLAKAREAGLIEQSARCRALLQRVVTMKNRQKDELRVAEARFLASELDAFAEDMENELDPHEEIDEEIDEVARTLNHLTKGDKRWKWESE